MAEILLDSKFIRMNKIAVAFIFFLTSFNGDAQNILAKTQAQTAFDLTQSAIYTDAAEVAAVQKSASLLQHDIQLVTGKLIPIIHQLDKQYKNLVAIGTLDNSSLVKKLLTIQKINTKNISGKWEAFQLQTIARPLVDLDNVLLITGADRRGAMYGVAELSKQIGVSPWYWWADVPAAKRATLPILKNVYYIDSPAVKYRGIFLNDEAPALSGWSKEKFGGFNHQFYEKVFELMVRLKSNYIWPAMWGNAFYDDDAKNIDIADEYGIVIGTSHHEPLMRAHDEWRRYGQGRWNYDSNENRLKAFWEQGLRRTGNTEKVVSVGMRGDGDEPMTQGTAISLLERIVKDQRDIIAEVSKKDASQTPQLWALYKEVQDYFDKGMRVPDDVTLLLCDDNWGNIRKLPQLNDKPRSGGYGIYYHFDYVGDPRNYKWINTNNIARVWEQMHLAYSYNVDKIWIVNVGDLKPMEFPISFFLDYAWKPSQWTANNISNYYSEWAAAQFGGKYATEIGQLIKKYGQISARTKPELLNATTYSIENYNEGNRVVHEYAELLKAAKKISNLLPETYADAFYQLVLHPIEANGVVHQMYVAQAWNKKYAGAGSKLANRYADLVNELYTKDSLITKYYNDTLANGKWSHMMDQTHIGYTYWQQPNKNKMPSVSYISTEGEPSQADLKTSIDESKWIPSKTVFKEKDGYISIKAPHYSKAVGSNKVQWNTIPDIGLTGDGITSFPVTENVIDLQKNTPHLQYDFITTSAGEISIQAYFSPSLDFHNEGGLKCAISVDDGAPQIINLHDGFDIRAWRKAVTDNMIKKSIKTNLSAAGKHTLKYWMLDGGVVLQKILIDLGGLKATYLGPQETLTAVSAQ
jgi:hypothetical protein